MYRNSFNQQLITTLVPDSLLYTRFPIPNTEIFRRPLQRHSVVSRDSINSGDKKQYLTLVSKKHKTQKRAVLKSSRKNGPKKIQSVILGGEKTTNGSLASVQRSLKSSLCRSSTSLQQRTQIMAGHFLNNKVINVQPYIQPSLINARPKCPLTIQNTKHQQFLVQKSKNEQLNKIISQKLVLDNHPQPQSAINLNVFKGVQNNQNVNGKFGGKFIRNTSSAGSIYFSLRNSVEKKSQEMNQDKEKPILTPRFEKASPEKQQRRRKNAGFIRSASAPKISYESAQSTAVDQSITAYQSRCDQSIKQVQIAKCIQKMSSIRKEIDELQDFLHDRLVTSQLKSKFLYKPSTVCLKQRQKSQAPSNEVSFSTINVDSRLQERESRYTPINSLTLQKNYQDESKSPLMEVKSSILNASTVTSRLSNCFSQNQQFQASSSIQNLYEMKLPTSIYNYNIQKQIVSEVSSRQARLSKDNQQNVFYHKNLLNSIR